MAHWSSGYADFHEELYAPPPRPVTPPALPCSECNATFTTLGALREHVFVAHPVADPALLLRGRPCGDRRELVQAWTVPAVWSLANCTKARLNGVDAGPHDVGRLLSAGRGIVEVRLSNDRSQREYEFDFAIADEADLRGQEGPGRRPLSTGGRSVKFWRPRLVIPGRLRSCFYPGRRQKLDDERIHRSGIALDYERNPFDSPPPCRLVHDRYGSPQMQQTLRYSSESRTRI